MSIHSELPAGPAAPLPVSARILVTEDPFVSNFLRAILERHGHIVVIGDAAHMGSTLPDVVITNRPETFLEFAASIHLLYIAATPDFHLASQFSTCHVLRKPFRNNELIAAVDALTHNLVP